MATIKLFTDGIHGGVDMSVSAFPQPGAAISATFGTTVFRLNYGGFYDQFTGTGFHYDSNHYPDAGTIFSWSNPRVQVTGISIPVTTYMSYYYASNWSGLIQTVLAGDDKVTGSSAAEWIYGYGGNDYLDGGKGTDHMNGGAGDDTYIVDDWWELGDITDSSGNDTLISSIFLGPTGRGDIENYVFQVNTGVEFQLVTAGSLKMGGGVDKLHGSSGDDSLDGGKGADQMDGGDGNDTYIVDNLADTVTEAPGEGDHDKVLSSVTFTLGANVDDLVLTGTAAINGTGNGDANHIIGNDAANTLDGGGGADLLEGLKGNDTYRIDNAGDQVIEAAKGGTDLVLPDIDIDLQNDPGFAGQEIENVTLQAGALKVAG